MSEINSTTLYTTTEIAAMVGKSTSSIRNFTRGKYKQLRWDGDLIKRTFGAPIPAYRADAVREFVEWCAKHKRPRKATVIAQCKRLTPNERAEIMARSEKIDKAERDLIERTRMKDAAANWATAELRVRPRFGIEEATI